MKMKKLIGATLSAVTLMSGAALLTPVQANAQSSFSIVVNEPPPAPRRERAREHRRGYVWSPGHWQWSERRNQYVWREGHYERARPGYAYRPPEWRERNGRWEYSAGRWDRDGDGVPNARDRDRDGDGVPNRRDARR
jgi:hypothetical protein